MIRRRLIVLALLGFALALLPASSAGAHALLDRTVPQRGSDLQDAPEYVAFYFSEPVEASFGAVRVFDSDGAQVEAGEVFRPGDESRAVAVNLQPSLDDGTYTATYRVISADSHPISGGFVFAIGDPGSGSSPTVSELIGDQGGSKAIDVAFWADRWLGYLAIAVGVGLLLFGWRVWRPVMAEQRSGEEFQAADSAFTTWAHRALMAAIGVGIVTSLLALPLQGALATDKSFFSALDPGVLGEVIDTRFGTVMAIRATAWVGLGVIFLGNGTRSVGRVLGIATVAWAALLIVSPGLAGHASSQDPRALLLAAATVHVAAMCVWIGGLFALALGVPRATRTVEGPDRTRLLSSLLARFSPLALGSVIAIAITGTIQAIVEVGSFGALIDTAFGRAVLIKIGLLLVLIGLGAVNRQRLLPAAKKLASAGERLGAVGRSIRRNLRLEVVLVIVVLGVTAALVSYPPSEAESEGPQSGETRIGDAVLEYTVDPATAGPNEVHLYLFDAETGAQDDSAKGIKVRLELPSADIGPLEVEPTKSGPGHYTITAAPFGVQGDWSMRVAVRTSRFDQDEVSVQVPIE